MFGSSCVVGLQVRAKSVEYAWQAPENPSVVELQTIVPSDADDNSISHRASAVWRRLEQLLPNAVAIAGYAAPEMLTALAWCRRRQQVAILMSESKLDDNSRLAWKEKIKGLVVRRYDAALVGGRPQGRYLETLGFPSEGVFTGYNVVDNPAYHPHRISKLPQPIKRPYFLMVNRFVAKKNLGFALDCYAGYRQRIIARGATPWDLVLAGDGPLRRELEAQVDALRLRSVVHFPGFLQQNELLPYLAHCEVFLHASTTEQWGLVVNEVMAAGRPVFVSRKCGCFEDLIEEGRTGLGFDPTNREELVQLMVQATCGNLPLARFGAAALAHIDNFTPLHFGRALQQAIEYGSRRLSSKPELR